jgi:glutamine amidotransferase
MNALEGAGLADAIREVTDHGRPYLGICFGLQLLFDEGEEHGLTPGLGRLRGRVTRFPDKDEEGEPLRVPHIGWNEVRFEGDHPMVELLPPVDVYYFVHSYRPVPTDESIIVGRADYGGSFTAAVAKDNVFAIQFHPEKSQSAGRRLLDAYREWLGAS